MRKEIFFIPDSSVVCALRDAQYVVEHIEGERFAITVPDDWNGTMLSHSTGMVVAVADLQLVYAWGMDQSLAHFFALLEWVTAVPISDTEQRYVLREHMFTTRTDGCIVLSHPLGTVLVPQEGRLVEEQQSQQGKITDPTERAKILEEVGMMVKVWLNLSNLPGGDNYDASDLVEKIVRGYTLLGEYETAGVYTAMIAHEKAHDWLEDDDTENDK